jgi:hypothetical protein
MLPSHSGTDSLSLITRTGTPIPFTLETIKGIEYAFFDASVTGNYVAVYKQLTTINGHVTLQGRPAAPDVQWQIPVVVDLYLPGSTTPLLSVTTTTDESGNFTVLNVPVGNYNIGVKSSHTLRRIKLNQNIVFSGNNFDFGLLLEGDVNKDNFVSALDLGPLLSSYNKTSGDPGFIINADLNGDGYVTALDLGLLLSNYNTAGEEPQ